ncbi:hypothetical protein RhiirA5_498240 [Rhizophagus irregularis]|uniref:Ion transport domain-containing protein n=1 Tax=Rhizophagus irregularis TaxID=588596 RepID=A0A2N0PVB7_9GLOM|nr:hypothetical protein RhiirA5_498240 [Rhizophagus irregularis]
METAIDIIDTKRDDLDLIQPHNEKVTDDYKPHNGKKISKLFISQDDSYVISYSVEDESIQGWLVNVEGNWQQLLDNNVYFKVGQLYNKVKFYKKSFLSYDYDSENNRIVKHNFIDLSDKKGQNFQLKHVDKLFTYERWIGFTSNGDLIITSLDEKLKDYKIYLYSINSKNATLLEYSQMYKIKFHKSLNEHNNINCFIQYQKLFLFNNGHLVQWELSETTTVTTFEKPEMQYNLFLEKLKYIKINKNKTLLAACGEVDEINVIYIYSMETGLCISRYDFENYFPVDFLTLKDGSERFIICSYSNHNHFKTLDPFHPSENSQEKTQVKEQSKKALAEYHTKKENQVAIDITDNITNISGPVKITFNSNKLFHVKENHVWVTDWVNETTFQQMLNKTCHSNIYTLPIFQTIQDMLNDIIKGKIHSFPKSNKIKLTDGKNFHFNLENLVRGYGNEIEVKGYTQINNEWKKTSNSSIANGILVSCIQLNNQGLALITTYGIYIYTIVEDFLRLRYLWSNKELIDYNKNCKDNELVEYKKIIQGILKQEFNCEDNEDNVVVLVEDNVLVEYKKIIRGILKQEFKESLPLPNLKFCMVEFSERDDLFLGIINDRDDFPKLISEILDIAINAVKSSESSDKDMRKTGDKTLKSIFEKIFDLIKKEDYSLYMKLLPFICLKLPKLCDLHYTNLVTTYILHTIILLDPSCLSVKNLSNTSLYAYSKDIYVKKIILSNSYFKSLLLSFYKNLSHLGHYLRTQISSFYHKLRSEKILTPTISFIVPFPKLCKYQKNDNTWNDMLYQPKSILFYSIDSSNSYEWWNFAAIIDFKWKTFGIFYYLLIWFFYAIFVLCFALAVTLNFSDELYRKILFIISILFGFIHLFFEFRQLLWNPRYYTKDPWNFFDIAAYSLPVITSIYWLINGQLLELAAITIIVLNFKFLMFFRVFESYGKYFAIIIGVAEEVFPFLIVLCFIIFGFGFGFFILLRPITNISLDRPDFNEDNNNPWNLATKYNYLKDGIIDPDNSLIQIPDSNTNMFTWFQTSIFAMYLLLTGDSGSLSAWTYLDNPTVTFLLFVFTFFTSIYLMNLFIGLLGMAIDNYNKHEEFLLSKAKIIMDIELFYMLPSQRNKKDWFPDWIYYNLPTDNVYKLIYAIDNGKTEFNFPPFINELYDKLEQTKDELKQELKEVKTLLTNLINNLNINSNNI